LNLTLEKLIYPKKCSHFFFGRKKKNSWENFFDQYQLGDGLELQFCGARLKSNI
jgi:hypothetical protein